MKKAIELEIKILACYHHNKNTVKKLVSAFSGKELFKRLLKYETELLELDIKKADKILEQRYGKNDSCDILTEIFS
jgi:tRNA U34 5-carboxymethylaminomethyl modifying GTPase MnmE/TrmE